MPTKPHVPLSNTARAEATRTTRPARVGSRRSAQRLPRARLHGGDAMRGSRPVGPGHAGRTALDSRPIARCHAHRRDIANRFERFLVALLMLAISVCQAGFPLTALAEDPDEEAGSDTLTFEYKYDYGNGPISVAFTASNGAVAYCLDYDKNEPQSGQEYVYSSTLTGALGYIALHGYNNTTVIEGEELTDDEAKAATQYAFWMERGALTRDGKLAVDTKYFKAGTTPKLRSRSERAWQAAVRLVDAAEAFASDPARNVADAPENTSSVLYVQNDGESGNQAMAVIVPVSGSIEMTKDSTDPRTISGGDGGSYSLQGAVYTVYRDSDCTQDTHTYLRTDADGTGRLYTKSDGKEVEATLPIGTYYVRETQAPKGYETDATTYEVEVRRDEVSQLTPTGESSHERPILHSISIRKESSLPSITRGNSLYSLSGAVYGVWNSLEGAQNLEDAGLAQQGDGLSDGSWYLVHASANSNYVLDADKGSSSVSLWRYTAADNQQWQLVANDDGTYGIVNRATGGALVASGDAGSSTVATSSDQNARRGWSVVEQDDGSYAITWNTGAALEPSDPTVESGTKVRVSQEDQALDHTWLLRRASSFQTAITTDEKGSGKASGLPDGTYYLREITAPVGYEPSSAVYQVTLDGADATQTVRETPLACVVDAVAYKRDGDAPLPLPELLSLEDVELDDQTEDTTMAGAEFTVSYYNGLYNTTDQLPSRPTRTWVLRTDSSGVASLYGALHDPDTYFVKGDDLYLNEDGDSVIPLGTVTVRETAAPEGYNLDDTQTHLRRITAQGGDRYRWTSSFSAVTVYDSGIRGDLVIRKTDSQTGRPIAGVPFLIRSKQSGEFHVVVTDEQGIASTAATPHTRNTNLNDSIVRDSSEELVLPIGMSDDAQFSTDSGIWFYLANNTRVQPSDERGALPYGDYTVEELQSDANSSYEPLAPFDVRISSERSIVQKSVTNTPISIATTLTDEATHTHVATSASTASLTDEVGYQGLTPGQEYQLEAVLMDRETGEALSVDGTQVTAQATFVPTASSGTTTVEFKFDASGLAGRTVVAFETLLRQGRKVADHADLDDQDQSVSFAQMRTRAHDQATGDVQATGARDDVLVDEVSYSGLTPGQTYQLVSTLHERSADGTDLGEASNATGETLTTTRDFVPEAADGTIEVALPADTSLFSGRTLVFFEEVRVQGSTVTSHEDISDDEQSIRVPGITTRAQDTTTSSHEGTSAQATRIEDQVFYSNLTPGRTYHLDGSLVERGTGEPISVDGSEVTSTADFTPEASSGEVTVTFDLPESSELAGRDVVVYERLSCDDTVVARHENPEDQEQTVSYPSVATHASNGQDGSDLAAGVQTTVTDEVAYSNLSPGQTYKLTGTLMNKQTHEPVERGGKAVTTTVDFVPSQADGTEVVTFDVDTTGWDGMTVVAFERLENDGHAVACHEDIDDADQSLYVPSIATTLTDDRTGGHTATPSADSQLTDHVRYTNLLAGQEYLMRGTLVSKETGEPIRDAEGAEVAVERSFVPATPDGEVTIAFDLDSSDLDGTAVVAFEKLLRKNTVVCEHADLHDDQQTVSIAAVAGQQTATPVSPAGTSPASYSRSGLPSTGDSSRDLLIVLALTGASCLVMSRLEFPHRHGRSRSR